MHPDIVDDAAYLGEVVEMEFVRVARRHCEEFVPEVVAASMIAVAAAMIAKEVEPDQHQHVADVLCDLLRDLIAYVPPQVH